MFASTFVAAFSAILFAQSAAAADCSRSYTAVEGDICDSISAAKNVSTYQFATVNYGNVNAECTNLVPGQSYCLGYAGSDCSTTTVVQAGDTCDIIEQKTGVNSTLLWLNNPQIDENCSNIYIGQVLCTASTVAVPDLPAGVVPVTAIPATATPAVSSTVEAAPTTTQIAVVVTTPAPVVSSTPAPAVTTTYSSPAPSATDDGDDDDDLPFCDEL